MPESRVLDPEANGWTLLREPNLMRHMLTACLLALPFVVAANWILFSSLDTFRSSVRSGPIGVLLLAGPLLLMVPVHEFLHSRGLLEGVSLATNDCGALVGAWNALRDS